MAGTDERYERYIKEGEKDPDIGVFVDALVEDGKGWLDAQHDLVVLEASEKIGRASGTLAILLVSALLGAGILVMASIALAIWLGRVFNDLALGFLAVAGIYLLIIAIFLLAQKALRDRITLAIINAIHEKD